RRSQPASVQQDETLCNVLHQSGEVSAACGATKHFTAAGGAAPAGVGPLADFEVSAPVFPKAAGEQPRNVDSDVTSGLTYL
ncbi:MAG TPA: hypothetical protein VLQ46_13345, partial [Casimicrobiaceae bacterium]|nr:hypothetical protein [Casimicrobiaceae bacterium]